MIRNNPPDPTISSMYPDPQILNSLAHGCNVYECNLEESVISQINCVNRIFVCTCTHARIRHSFPSSLSLSLSLSLSIIAIRFQIWNWKWKMAAAAFFQEPGC